MKLILFICLFALISCGPESSPEGRMGLKLDGLQKRLDSLNEAPEIAKTVDSLKAQNARLSDSLKKLSKDIDVLKKTQ